MRYIRVNEVDAEPMKFGEFKKKFPKSGGANVERGAEDDGYVVTYRKGQANEYVSWCPKAEFEAVSIPCADGCMPFGCAIIECVTRGKRITRKGWNGEGQFVRFETVLQFPDGKPKEGLAEGESQKAEGSSCLVFHFKNRHTGETGVQVGWLASQGDMKANDWVMVE